MRKHTGKTALILFSTLLGGCLSPEGRGIGPWSSELPNCSDPEAKSLKAPIGIDCSQGKQNKYRLGDEDWLSCDHNGIVKRHSLSKESELVIYGEQVVGTFGHWEYDLWLEPTEKEGRLEGEITVGCAGRRR